MKVQKNATPTAEQQAVLKKAGLPYLYWTVVKDFPDSMIIRHRLTGEFKHINKKSCLPM